MKNARDLFKKKELKQIHKIKGGDGGGTIEKGKVKKYNK